MRRLSKVTLCSIVILKHNSYVKTFLIDIMLDLQRSGDW